MSKAEEFLAEFNAEAVTTRKFLEQIPEDKLTWQPHPKSMSVGQLGFHIAMFPGPVAKMALQESFDMGSFDRQNPQPKSVREILETFEQSIATVRELLPKFTDERLKEIWKMKFGDKEVLAIPRSLVLRNILLNHGYHHRGQLGVYLRLLEAKVPSAYGPSGDEQPDFLKR